MESHLKSTPPCSADKLLTSNILFKFKFVFQKRKFDYRNLSKFIYFNELIYYTNNNLLYLLNL